jgi:chromosome segregation ATPase
MQLRLLLTILASATLLAMGQQPSAPSTNNAMAQTTTKGASPVCPDIDQLRKNVAQLSAENQRLKKRVTDLERERLVTTIQEQLEKEEQRGENLQQHLFAIAEKEAPLSARLDRVNQLLSPEVIEKNLAGVGSVHPEDAREDVRKALTSEKARIQTQLDLLKQDQRRTQASLATTDAAIQRLKQKLLEAQRPQ